MLAIIDEVQKSNVEPWQEKATATALMAQPPKAGTITKEKQLPELGVTGALTGLAGNLAALLAIRVIADAGDDPAGKLHLFDGLTGALRKIRIVADAGCRSCG